MRFCATSDDYVRRVAPEVERVVGIYEAGFESSSFAPCRSRERWWLVADSAFAAQYRRLQESAETDGPFRVLVEAEGVVSRRGRHGHLGQYDRLLTVRRLVSMETFPTC